MMMMMMMSLEKRRGVKVLLLLQSLVVVFCWPVQKTFVGGGVLLLLLVVVVPFWDLWLCESFHFRSSKTILHICTPNAKALRWMRAVFFVTLFSLTTKSPPPFTYIYTHTEEIEERKKTREADAQAAQSWRSKGLINSQRASTRAFYFTAPLCESFWITWHV
jgi:hypothetical protein